MEKSDISQPIKTILDGSNFVSWSQEMSSFLKGRKLWRYVTGTLAKPIKQKDEDDVKYSDRLEDWDSKNHQILTWIRNTTIPSIKIQFGRFETAKEVWDLLSTRYSITDVAHQYKLFETLRTLKQAPGQSINDFLALMHSIWDQLTLSEPQWENAKDAANFYEYRDKQRVMQFLMALEADYENLRGSLLHRETFPTLESVVAELLSEETRLGMLKSHKMEYIMPSVVLAVSNATTSTSSVSNKLDVV